MTYALYPQPQPIGQPFTIEDVDGWWQHIAVHYDYRADAVHCPNCGGVGIPWRGWYHCDSVCQGKGLVADGRFFVPVAAPAEEPDVATFAWEP